MTILAAIALAIVALVPAGTAAQATDLTGSWNAKFTRPAPNGETQSGKFIFQFTQKGKQLSGTVVPGAGGTPIKIEKGAVNGANVTFRFQQPNGPLRSFELTHAKGRLTGTMKLDFKGQTGMATVEADRAK